MIIHDYDDQSEPMISLANFYGTPKKLVRKCLIIFSGDIYRHMTEAFECRKIGEIGTCNGRIPINSFIFEGEEIAFYLSCIGSAMAADLCYEAHWQVGAEDFIMFGSCGSLDRDKTVGHYVIPTEAYRGEGLSYYFAPAADYIRIQNAEKVASLFDSLKLPYVMGRVWTTDCMLRETVNLTNKRREEGCIAVEMELAGVEALCDYYGLRLYDFLEAGDVLSESSYDVSGLASANHDTAKLYIAIKIASLL